MLEGGHERLGDAVLAAQAQYLETGSFSELLAITTLLRTAVNSNGMFST